MTVSGGVTLFFSTLHALQPPSHPSFLFCSFEIRHEPAHVLHLMMDTPWVPILAISLYCIGIVVGKAYFKDRDPWNWRRLMSVWNLGLSVFSAIGFLRVLPYTLHILTTNSLEQMLCTDPEHTYGSGSTGLWVQMFILSKFPWVIIYVYSFDNDLLWSHTHRPHFASFITTVNSLTLSLFSFTRRNSFSCIGTITLLSCCIAGIPMSLILQAAFSLSIWIMASIPSCISIISSWPSRFVHPGPWWWPFCKYRKCLSVSHLLFWDLSMWERTIAPFRTATTWRRFSCMGRIWFCFYNSLSVGILSSLPRRRKLKACVIYTVNQRITAIRVIYNVN